MDLLKITPNFEMAKSIVEMVSLIEERILSQNRKRMASLIIADYYEIIKELMTAILLIDGFKTLSHKDLIDYIKGNYKDFTEHETSILDNLRIIRNRITYEGFKVENSYLDRNEELFKSIINKMRKLLNKRLK